MENKKYSDIITKNLETEIDKLENESDLIDDEFFKNSCRNINSYYKNALSDASNDLAQYSVPIFYNDIFKEAQYYQEEIMEVIRNGVSDNAQLYEILQEGICRGYENGLYENIENLSLSCSYLNTIDYVKENKDKFDEICSNLEKVDKEFKVENVIDDLKVIAEKNSDLYRNEDLKVSEKSEELNNYLGSLENSLELKKEIGLENEEKTTKIKIPKKEKNVDKGNER